MDLNLWRVIVYLFFQVCVEAQTTGQAEGMSVLPDNQELSIQARHSHFTSMLN